MAVRSRAPLAPTIPLYREDAAGLPARTVTPSFRFPFRLLFLLSLLPVLLGASMLLVYREQQSERIYPGISVYSVGLGGLTREQAAGAIKNFLTDQSKRPFRLRYDDDAATVSLAALGLRIDDGETAQLAERAWKVGRDDDLRSWLRSQVQLLRKGYALPVAVGIDRERAAAALAKLAPEVERPVLNASFSVEKAGEQFEIHTLPAHTGRRLNVNATLDLLQRSLINAIPDRIDLVLDEARPSIVDTDLQQAVETVQTILGEPLELRDGQRVWRLDANTAYQMLEINGLDSGHPPISAKLNEAKLREFVEKTAKAADVPARNPYFEVEGDQVVVRKGTPGKLVDVDALFDVVRLQAVTPLRQLNIPFKDDQPWLTEADLELARQQANALLDAPIVIETPAGQDIPDRKWLLDRAALAQLVVLPNTQVAPRDYATLPPAQRPRFDVQLDSGRVTNWLSREVAPWVSLDPVDAQLEMTTSFDELPNPAYAAALDAERAAARPSPSGTPAATLLPTPLATPLGTPLGTTQALAGGALSPVIRVAHPQVGLRNAKDGRGPDYLGTFASMQVVFRNGPTVSAAVAGTGVLAGATPAATAASTPTAAAAGTPGAGGTPLAGQAGTGLAPLPRDAATVAQDMPDRRVTVRLAARAPRVPDRDLALARDMANFLIGEPMTLTWKDASWTVSREELSAMLRYQQSREGLTAYLTRDGLLAKAADIAREADRRPDAPRDSKGQLLPMDVAATAAAIWQQASTVPANRKAEIVWTEEEVPVVVEPQPTPAFVFAR